MQWPQSFWSEQDPIEWWAALERAVTRLRHDNAGAWAAVRAIGLSGQMHGAVVLDAGKRVLRPAMLWNDGRGAAQCPTLEGREPALFQSIARMLLPKDWIRLQLCGEAVSEMSDASGSLWLDVGARCWSDALLAATGLSRAQMPRLVEGNAVSGGLTRALARRWRLRATDRSD